MAGSPDRDALAGRVVVVTGASAGIGEATARLAAKHGARLVLAARRTDGLQALVTVTEFHDQLRAGSGSGAGRPRLPGLDPQSPEEVAEAILDLVITGAESAVLVPDQLRQRRP